VSDIVSALVVASVSPFPVIRFPYQTTVSTLEVPDGSQVAARPPRASVVLCSFELPRLRGSHAFLILRVHKLG
jgi:hypothetical protein